MALRYGIKLVSAAVRGLDHDRPDLPAALPLHCGNLPIFASMGIVAFAIFHFFTAIPLDILPQRMFAGVEAWRCNPFLFSSWPPTS
jgi:hypothetical protein